MTIEDFFKHLGFSIKFGVTSSGMEYKIPIEISYRSRYNDQNDTYKFRLFFTYSQTNCGLLYFDGLDYIINGVYTFDYLMPKKYYPKFKTLSTEDLKELGFLYTKYMLYNAWKKVSTSKRLVFIHTGFKDSNSNFDKDTYTNFLKLVDSHYESPVNINSGRTQLHGVVKIHNLQNIEVPDKFITHFKDE